MSISNERKKELINFEKTYGLDFSDLNLLNKAFVHTSYTGDLGLDSLNSYERLEFLGDAVLKLTVSKFLFEKYPDKKEGELTSLRAEIVSDKYIHNFALKLGLENLIILGKNEKNQGGAKKESILACAFEALLGAVFLNYKDKGYKKTYEFLINNFENEILDVQNRADTLNPKAILQEYTQSIDKTLPQYKIVNEEGKAHNKTFFVEVYYQNKLIGKGQAKTIKQAEQESAFDAIEKLGIKNE